MALNKCIFIGRLVRDVEFKTVGDNVPVANFTIAVDKRYKAKDQKQPTADFVPVVAWRKSAEFAEKYFRQGMRVSVSGRIQTGSYTNKDGVRVYTTEVVIEEQEFAESKNSSSAGNGGFTGGNNAPAMQDAGDGFMNIPDGIDEELPFN